MGEEVEVLVSDPQIVSILQHGLLRGAWLRLRNLLLTEVPSIHFALPSKRLHHTNPTKRAQHMKEEVWKEVG